MKPVDLWSEDFKKGANLRQKSVVKECISNSIAIGQIIDIVDNKIDSVYVFYVKSLYYDVQRNYLCDYVEVSIGQGKENQYQLGDKVNLSNFFFPSLRISENASKELKIGYFTSYNKDIEGMGIRMTEI